VPRFFLVPDEFETEEEERASIELAKFIDMDSALAFGG